MAEINKADNDIELMTGEEGFVNRNLEESKCQTN